MRITHCETTLLHLETGPALLVSLVADSGVTGLGFTRASSGGSALQAIIDHELSPMLVGEDPLGHERLFAKARWQMREPGWRGLVARAYAAIDLALWDLKGKSAGMPLYQLLG